MADPKKTEPEAKAMTVAEAVKLCKKTVAKLDEKGQPVRDKEGNPVTVQVQISESELLNETSFAEYEDRVVVVLKDGSKWSGPKSKK